MLGEEPLWEGEEPVWEGEQVWWQSESIGELGEWLFESRQTAPVPRVVARRSSGHLDVCSKRERIGTKTRAAETQPLVLEIPSYEGPIVFPGFKGIS